MNVSKLVVVVVKQLYGINMIQKKIYSFVFVLICTSDILHVVSHKKYFQTGKTMVIARVSMQLNLD